ncbi:MAG: peptide chain release factor N(5)-glutamine methyltransferase [Acidobacteriaceae bacterium]
MQLALIGTLRDAISTATARLAAKVELSGSAARDAELLLLHTLRLPRSAVYSDPDRRLSEEEQAAYTRAVERRLAFEPIQYITGKQEFFGLELEVGPGVLIPRPETELLVEAALERLAGTRSPRVLDVGTGTGAIAVALASRLPEARITAVDVCEAALGIARRNIRRYCYEDRIDLRRSDLLQDLPDAGVGFDAILSNPPYVPQPDRPAMHPEVREYEPALALFAGEDGLAVYRRLIPQAHSALAPGGMLAMEMGYGQSDSLRELLCGWYGVEVRSDLRGIPRVVLALRP